MKAASLALGAFMVAGLLGVGSPATASTLAAKNGMTLYVFDKDNAGKSNCYGFCAVIWPPYKVQSGQSMGQGWTKVSRKNGSMQWAFHGRPVYFYAGDHKPGDTRGDGKEGIWHIVSA